MVSAERSDLEMAGLRFQIGIFEEALVQNDEDTEALRFLSHGYAVTGRMEDGLAIDRRLVVLLPRDERVRYNLACSCALTGRSEEALTTLARAVDLGFRDAKLIDGDTDLDAIREDPRFDEIMGRIKTEDDA